MMMMKVSLETSHNRGHVEPDKGEERKPARENDHGCGQKAAAG